MSLEKKKDKEEQEENSNLEESTFRDQDFTPLSTKSRNKDGESVETEELEKIEKIEVIEGLSEIEKDVLEIAKEVLKLKRYDAEFEIKSQTQIQKYPIIENLYATCISKLAYNKGYSKEDIFLAIRDLEEKNWIVTNERRTKLEILQNEKLRDVLDFIERYPGVHARDEKVEEELGITRTPFLKHIMTLENFNLIRSKKIGRRLHYFIQDVPDEYDKYKALFFNPLIPEIIEKFFEDETVSITSIAEDLDVYPGTISYHINKMEELDIIKEAKNSKGKKIHVINIELLKKYNNVFKEPNFSELLKGL
jgi:DNA-binding transcriptional ArsR family regulator